MKHKLFTLLLSIVAAGSVGAQSNTTNPQSNYLDSLYSIVFDRLVQTGSRMPDGRGDIRGIDENLSSFYRATWSLNEFPADGGWWIWPDAGIPDLQQCNWTSENHFAQSVYLRLLYNLNLQNTYLSKAESLNLFPTEQVQVRCVR